MHGLKIVATCHTKSPCVLPVPAPQLLSFVQLRFCLRTRMIAVVRAVESSWCQAKRLRSVRLYTKNQIYSKQNTTSNKQYKPKRKQNGGKTTGTETIDRRDYRKRKNDNHAREKTGRGPAGKVSRRGRALEREERCPQNVHSHTIANTVTTRRSTATPSSPKRRQPRNNDDERRTALKRRGLAEAGPHNNGERVVAHRRELRPTKAKRNIANNTTTTTRRRGRIGCTTSPTTRRPSQDDEGEEDTRRRQS